MNTSETLERSGPNADLDALLGAVMRLVMLNIIGTSGGGKSTLISFLLEFYSKRFGRVITYTTRPPRTDLKGYTEQHEVDYCFVDVEEFMRLVALGFFLEDACVFGNHYGTPKDQVKAFFDAGKIPIVNLDIQGARRLQGRSWSDFPQKPELIQTFISPTTIAELERRLRLRGTDPEEVIGRRLQRAPGEFIEARENIPYFIPSGTKLGDLRAMESILIAELLQFKYSPVTSLA